MKTKFKKGQKLICIHYKDKPVVMFDEIIEDIDRVEVWVKDQKGRLWWGPEDWFKVVKELKRDSSCSTLRAYGYHKHNCCGSK